MIDESRFPRAPYRQSSNECIPASFATGIFQFTSLDVAQCVADVCSDWSGATGSSGYDRLFSVIQSGSSASVVAARSQLRIERRHGLAGLDDLLQFEAATAIVALSFPSRGPHSVCVSHDGSQFVLRDSAAGNLGPSDGTADSVTAVVALVPTNGSAGDVIVFRAV